MELKSVAEDRNPGCFSAQRKSVCNNLGEESKRSNIACNRLGTGSIPARSNAASRDGPGEMIGSVRRAEMAEKSFCEKLGSGFLSGLGLGLGAACGGADNGWGSGGHLMRGLPGTESHDWSEQEKKRRATV